MSAALLDEQLRTGLQQNLPSLKTLFTAQSPSIYTISVVLLLTVFDQKVSIDSASLPALASNQD